MGGLLNWNGRSFSLPFAPEQYEERHLLGNLRAG